MEVDRGQGTESCPVLFQVKLTQRPTIKLRKTWESVVLPMAMAVGHGAEEMPRKCCILELDLL